MIGEWKLSERIHAFDMVLSGILPSTGWKRIPDYALRIDEEEISSIIAFPG